MTELPPGWSNAALRELCEINPRVDKNSIDADAVVSFVPMAAVEAETGRIDVSQTRPFCKVRRGYTPFRKGDILFAKITPCMENGKIGIAPDMPSEYGFGSTEFHVLRPAEGIDPRFLCHAVSNRAFRHHAEHNMTGAVGQKRVPASVLEEHEIGFPPAQEQRRIVERIETLFDEIDGGAQSLRDAKRLIGLYRQSLLNSAFEGRLTADWRAENPNDVESHEDLAARAKQERDDWCRAALREWASDLERWQGRGASGPRPRRPEASSPGAALTSAERTMLPAIPSDWMFLRLSDIAAVGSGMSVSKARKPEAPVEVPYLRVANVQRGSLDLREVKTMQIERSQRASLRLRRGDVLFNEGGDRDKLGRGWIWEGQIVHCITQNHVFRASPFRRDLNWSKYLSQWGNSFGREYFEKGGKQTTNLASINMTVLKALPVPYCGAAEQAEIVRILDARLGAVDALESEIGASLARADVLRQSILKKALSGKLVPQDPDDEPAHTLLARIRADHDRDLSSKLGKPVRRRATAAK